MAPKSSPLHRIQAFAVLGLTWAMVPLAAWAMPNPNSEPLVIARDKAPLQMQIQVIDVVTVSPGRCTVSGRVVRLFRNRDATLALGADIALRVGCIVPPPPVVPRPGEPVKITDYTMIGSWSPSFRIEELRGPVIEAFFKPAEETVIDGPVALELADAKVPVVSFLPSATDSPTLSSTGRLQRR